MEYITMLEDLQDPDNDKEKVSDVSAPAPLPSHLWAALSLLTCPSLVSRLCLCVCRRPST
jgi:hypothetical protein